MGAQITNNSIQHINNDCKCYIEAQGRLLAVRLLGVSKVSPGGGRRGVVKGFSRASRRRLLRFVARLKRDLRAVFITLTYPQPKPPIEAKEDLHRFCKYLLQRYPLVSLLWRFETESSGERDYHPHFHIVALGVSYIPFRLVEELWSKATGQSSSAMTRVERPRGGVFAYVAKYMAKVESLGLSSEGAYLVTGRMWGVYGRRNLVYYLATCVLALADASSFFMLRRLLRRAFKLLYLREALSFLVIVRYCAIQWLNLAKGEVLLVS